MACVHSVLPSGDYNASYAKPPIYRVSGSIRLNLAMSEMSRRYCGSAFQSVGPAMLKALLPAMVDRVNGTHSIS